jgi:tetratricopeptide (TPR) repeat protein
VAYGLTIPTAQGDSVVYRTDQSSFIINQAQDDLNLYRYGFVALSWSDYSDAAFTFDDYFHYAESMAHARKYQEALGSWILALETMGKLPGMVNHIAKRMAEVSGDLLRIQNIDLALSFVKEAFKLAPKSEFVQNKYRDAVMAHYAHLINQREINTVLGDMQLNIHNQALRSIYLETADTLARVLSLQDNLNSINDAIKVQKKMLEWESNPKYRQALAFSFFELYKFKSIRETSALELRSILDETLANSRDAYNLLKASGQSYFASHITMISAMNELAKYEEAQLQATSELGASAALMSKDVQVIYRTELAKAFSLQGNLSGAESEYMTILGIQPNNRIAKEALVEVLMEESKYDAASDVLQQLMLGNEETPTYTLLLGRIALLKSNAGEAIFQLEKVLTKDPSLKQTFIYLADAYSMSGNMLQAKKYYNQALQHVDELIAKIGQGNQNKRFTASLPKERTRILSALVQINMELQDYKSALAAAQRLIKMDETVAESHYQAGNAAMQLGRVYNAIEYYNRALILNPENVNYGAAMNAARNLRDQQLANSTSLAIGDVLVNEIFPSIYKNYADVHQLPAGEFVVTNNTDALITPTSITVFCAELMSAPTQVNAAPISAKSNSIIRFPALFNESILENTEARNLQMDVSLVFVQNGIEQTIRKSGTFILNGRNAIVWSDKRRMASFIAPGSEMLVDYNKRADQVFKGMPKFGLNRSVLKAGQLYAALNQSDLAYSSDPNQGYASLSLRTEVKDYLQFPLETFVRRGGDCDDLVALYGALLESGGVSAAYIDVPGHVMAAFDCGIKPGEMGENGLLANEVIVLNDKVWIPVEATKIGASGFFVAWKAAADRYYRELEAGHFPELIPFGEAWNIYKPTSYQPKGLTVEVPSDARVKEEYKQFVVQFVSKTKQNALDELSARITAEPENVFIRNAYGTLLTQTGQYDKARKVFLETLEMTPESAIVVNNLGNIDFLQGKYSDAISHYSQAVQLDEDDAQIHVNLCKAYLQLSEKSKAREEFEKAITLDASISDIYQELKKQIQ